MTPSLAGLQAQFGSLARKKGLVVWAVKYGAVFAVFLVVFIPVYTKLSEHASKASSMKHGIEDMKKISVSLLGKAETEAMRARVERFESSLTDASQSAKLLDKISDQAEKNHLNVIQIFSDNPVLLRDEQSRDLEVQGKKLNLLPVNFRVETDLKTLAGFLHALGEEPKGGFVVESIHLQKTSPEAETLQCDITLSFILK